MHNNTNDMIQLSTSIICRDSNKSLQDRTILLPAQVAAAVEYNGGCYPKVDVVHNVLKYEPHIIRNLETFYTSKGLVGRKVAESATTHIAAGVAEAGTTVVPVASANAGLYSKRSVCGMPHMTCQHTHQPISAILKAMDNATLMLDYFGTAGANPISPSQMAIEYAGVQLYCVSTKEARDFLGVGVGSEVSKYLPGERRPLRLIPFPVPMPFGSILDTMDQSQWEHATTMHWMAVREMMAAAKAWTLYIGFKLDVNPHITTNNMSVCGSNDVPPWTRVKVADYLTLENGDACVSARPNGMPRTLRMKCSYNIGKGEGAFDMLDSKYIGCMNNVLKFGTFDTGNNGFLL